MGGCGWGGGRERVWGGRWVSTNSVILFLIPTAGKHDSHKRTGYKVSQTPQDGMFIRLE